jgi:plasmid maintenance system killer protein
MSISYIKANEKNFVSIGINKNYELIIKENSFSNIRWRKKIIWA